MNAYNHLSTNHIKVKDNVISVSLPHITNKFEIGVTPPIISHSQRIDEDILKSYALIQKFDEAYNVVLSDDTLEDSIFTSSTYFETIMNPIERLDLQIYYLRKVHNVCYYSCQHFSDELQPWKQPPVYYLRPHIYVDDLPLNEASIEQKNWVKQLDEKIDKLLNSDLSPPQKVTLSNQFVQMKWDAYCEENTQKDSQEKYRCTLCRKCFIAPHHVANHLKKHHSGALEEIIDAVARKIMKDSYLNDPNPPGPKISVYTEEQYKSKQRSHPYTNHNMPPVMPPHSYMPISDSHHHTHRYGHHSYSRHYHHLPTQPLPYADAHTSNYHHNIEYPPLKRFRDYDNADKKLNETKRDFSRPIMTYDDL